jgi:drug/metabolite transporter (DMT)-like permease
VAVGHFALMAIVLGLFSAVTYGAADFLGGLSTKRNPVVRVVLLSQAVGSVLYLAAFPLLPSGRLTSGALVWGGLSGLAGAAGVGFLYRGLARGRMSVVAPTTAVVFSLIPVGFGLAIGERPGVLQVVGIAVAIPAVALVSSAPEPARSSLSQPAGLRARLATGGALDALVAGVAIGLWAIFLDRSGDDTGPWPLVSARIAALLVFGIAAAVVREELGATPGTWPTIAAAGALDVTANLLYLLAVREGLLSLVAVVTSLYPVATVLLARVFLGERLSGPQVAGVVVALAGVVLMSAG